MAVSFVVPRYLPRLGGIEVHVREVSTRLAAAGVDVEVVSQEHGLRGPEQRPGVDIDRIVMYPGTRDLLGQGVSLGAWRHVRAAAAQGRVVHLQNFHALSTLLAGTQPFARRTGPLVLTPHYLGIPAGWRGRLHRPYAVAFRPVFAAVDRVVCVSSSEAAELQRDHGVEPRRITVIPNGVDAELLAAAEPVALEHRAVVSAGRLMAYKGHPRLIDALPALPDDVHLHLIGDGPDAAAFVAQAQALGVAGRLHVHARMAPTELARWYAAADAVVSLSERECFGMTLAEGLAAGAPIVASDIPAHRDVVALAGLEQPLVSRAADPAAVARSVEAALTRGRHAAGAVAVPSWDHVAARHAELYAELGASA